MERKPYRYDEKWGFSIMYTEKALDLINSFINSELKGNIDNLQHYSFWGIENKSIFNGIKGDFDGDRTNIVYAIDYLLYKDTAFPNFTLKGFPSNDDTSANYSGETINTFNTLFAKDLSRRNEIQKKFGSEWYLIQDINESNNPFANDFYHVYQRICNFMLFPNIKADSLNTFKFSGFKDFADLFFYDLKNVLSINNVNKNEKMNQIIKLDKLYFKNKTFEQFLNDFYLNEYELLTIEGMHYYHWYPQLLSNEKVFDEYKSFALKYVSQASKFIELRSKKIKNILKNNYFS